MNNLIERITIGYGSKEIIGIALVNFPRNNYGNPNAFVSKNGLMEAFPGLTEIRLQKALQRAKFIAKSIDTFNLQGQAVNVEGEIFYKFNCIKGILDGLAKRRPYIDTLREAYFVNPKKKRNKTLGTISKSKPKNQSLKRLPASLVGEWIKACQPIGDSEFSAANHCYLDSIQWDDNYWTETEAKHLQTFLDLTNDIHRVLWQVDNTIVCSDIDSSCDYKNNPRVILQKLIEYNLVYLPDKNIKAASANELFDLGENDDSCNWGQCAEDLKNALIEFAFVNSRWDILAAFEVGHKEPINRTTHWHTFYEEQLGKEGVDYWQWLPNKESLEICEELTLLLSLERPDSEAMIVLSVLPHGKNPFDKTKAYNVFSFSDFCSRPKFYEWEPKRRAEVRTAFIQWHEQTLEAIGRENLEAIYKICYKVTWDIIEDILEQFSGTWFEVLGVSSTATLSEVKKAYKNLARKYHPDINPNGAAKMIIINSAFEQYEDADPMEKIREFVRRNS